MDLFWFSMTIWLSLLFLTFTLFRAGSEFVVRAAFVSLQNVRPENLNRGSLQLSSLAALTC